MKKICLVIFIFCVTVAKSQNIGYKTNQTVYFNEILNGHLGSDIPIIKEDYNKNSITSKTLKTNNVTYFNVNYRDVVAANGYTPVNGHCIIFPDTSARWEGNDTIFGEIGKNAFGNTAFPYNFKNGVMGFSKVFTPGTQLIKDYYTPNNSDIKFSSTNATVVDSVAFYYFYNRAKAFPATVDTLITYFVNNSDIQSSGTGGNWPSAGDVNYNITRISNYDYLTQAPSTFFKSDTILLTVTDSTSLSLLKTITLSVDSHIIAPGGSMGIAWKYVPGRPLINGDTILDLNNFTAKSDQSIFGIGTYFEDGVSKRPFPLARTGTESPSGNMCAWLRPNDFHGMADIYGATYQWSHAWVFGAFNEITPVFEHASTIWTAAPIGISLTATNVPTNADCRNVTFTATDNFNADSWSWDFGDGSILVTDTNITTHNYVNPSAIIAVTCTASTGTDSFVALVNTPVLNICTGIKDVELDEIFGYYPNPANNVVNIEINSSEAQNLKVSIIDLLGVCVYSNTLSNINSYKNTINISNFAKGIYIIKVANTSSTITKKLIIE